MSSAPLPWRNEAAQTFAGRRAVTGGASEDPETYLGDAHGRDEEQHDDPEEGDADALVAARARHDGDPEELHGTARPAEDGSEEVLVLLGRAEDELLVVVCPLVALQWGVSGQVRAR